MRLWIDDLRRSRADWDGPLLATTSAAAIDLLGRYGDQITEVSFDHDLGGDDTTRLVVLWMAEHDVWPARCYVHTANPVGREWLVGMIERYGPGVTR